MCPAFGTRPVRWPPSRFKPVERKVLVDRFGQKTGTDFAAKVTTEDALREDVERDRAYYATLKPAATDAYGGLPGSGAKFGLAKTGYFHLGKAGNAQVLVTPEGNAFFQLGMCGVSSIDDYTLVRGRESIYEALPAFNDPKLRTAYRDNDSGTLSILFGTPFDCN